MRCIGFTVYVFRFFYDFDLNDIITKIEAFASDHDNIAAAYLFGSAATGRMRKHSDMDITLMSKVDVDGFERVAVETALSNLIGRDVDVVIFHQADALMQHQILKYGQMLYEKDRDERIRQETFAWHRYFYTRFLYRKAGCLIMVDRELLSRKISKLSMYVDELQKADDIDWNKYQQDSRSRAFVERYLHLSIETVFDISNHRPSVCVCG